MRTHRFFLIVFLIVFGILFLNNSNAQNLNPPFPRIGQIYFYPAGSGDEIWKNHDLIGIRHYLSSDARRIRETRGGLIYGAMRVSPKLKPVYHGVTRKARANRRDCSGSCVRVCPLATRR